MAGDDRKRFCSECRLTVYNLSAMTRDEATAMLVNAEGRLCAGFFRRADGTVLTRDCPVGLAAVRAKTVAGLRRIAAAVSLLVGGGTMLGFAAPSWWKLRDSQPFSTVCRWLGGRPTPVQTMIVGEICPPIAPVPTPTPNAQ
jgi:hypothetical protein